MMCDFSAIDGATLQQMLSDARKLCLDNPEELYELYPMFAERLIASVKGVLAEQYPSFALAEESGEEWFFNSDSNMYWNSYEAFLQKKGPKWNLISQVIDNTTTRIMNFTSNPTNSNFRKTKGLVMGRVQSGKTANYTGLIAKAADAGYNLIIILAGTNNTLRDQTQRRLDSDLFDYDENFQRMEWLKLTQKNQTIGEKYLSNDFGGNTPISINNLPLDGDSEAIFASGIPVVAVIKKRSGRIGKLREWMVGDEDEGVVGFSEELKNSLNILILDDEADAASINTFQPQDGVEENTDGDDDIDDIEATAINRNIRAILHNFSRSTYIGYTATPYASVLINPFDEQVEIGPTLYPRDFILSLPEPQDVDENPIHYDGLTEFFTDDGELVNQTLVIPFAEGEWVKNPPLAGEQEMDIPPSLNNSLKDFFITGAIRSLRGDGDKHHSMLIHNSMLRDHHQNLLTRVVNLIRYWRLNYSSEDWGGRHSLHNEFCNRWEGEFNSGEFDWDVVDGAISKFLANFEQATQVRRINSTPPDSDEVIQTQNKLNYENYPNGLKVIAIGGSILSRGLTIEGLTISYFTRETALYDSLTQMGRWFGFHPNYRDLIRINVTTTLNRWFGWLNHVEESLRSDIERYDSWGRTPLDLAPRILKHIREFPGQEVMQVTRAGARRDAEEYSRGLNGTTPEIRRYPIENIGQLNRNITATGNFLSNIISNIGAPETFTDGAPGAKLWSGVPVDFVLQLLNDFGIHQDEMQFRIEQSLIPYIQRRFEVDQELQYWRVALFGDPSESTAGKLFDAQGVDFEIGTIGRGAVYGGRIETLSDKRHWAIDFEGFPNTIVDFPDDYSDNDIRSLSLQYRNQHSPLLLIYVLDKDYEPIRTGRGRDYVNIFHGINEKQYLVGLGMMVPDSPSITEEETQTYIHARGVVPE